jgi:hypothetical protein
MNLRKSIIGFTIFICLGLLVPMSSGCTGPNEKNRYMELLHLLPATTGDSGCFVVIDDELFRQANGISLYNSNNEKISQEEYFEIILAKVGDKTLIVEDVVTLCSQYAGPFYILPAAMKEQYVGYDSTYVDAEINNYTAWPYSHNYSGVRFIPLPDILVAAIGRFSPQATVKALDDHQGWPAWAVDNYVSTDYKDIQINSWIDGNKFHIQDPYSPPHLDQVGRARPFAVTDKYLFVGTSEEAVKSLIDTSMNEAKVLADIPEYSIVAKELYKLDARMAAIIGDAVHTNGYWEDYEDNHGPFLKKFLTFGTSFGKDDKGDYMALVLLHENSDSALDNVTLLERRINTWGSDSYLKPWNELIYDTEIHAEGKILTAKLYTNVPGLWVTWFTSQDNLLIHEE